MVVRRELAFLRYYGQHVCHGGGSSSSKGVETFVRGEGSGGARDAQAPLRPMAVSPTVVRSIHGGSYGDAYRRRKSPHYFCPCIAVHLGDKLDLQIQPNRLSINSTARGIAADYTSPNQVRNLVSLDA